jgi:hypothetical protein
MQAIDIREFRVDFVGARFLNGSDCENLFQIQAMLAISCCARRPPLGFRGFRVTDPDARDWICELRE